MQRVPEGDASMFVLRSEWDGGGRNGGGIKCGPIVEKNPGGAAKAAKRSQGRPRRPAEPCVAAQHVSLRTHGAVVLNSQAQSAASHYTALAQRSHLL